MAKEQNSGEDLIEKVEQEVVETTEETKESTAFDPKAFVNSDEVKDAVEETSEEKTLEETTKTEEDDDDNDFSWDKVEVESEEEEEKKEEEDWDTVVNEVHEKQAEKENVKEAVYDWETLAAELGVKATDEKTFKEAVKSAIDEPSIVTDTITELQNFIKMSDHDLVKSDLHASGLEKEEIEDTVNRMHDSGLLKREALVIRKNLQNYIASERTKAKKEQAATKQNKEEENLKNRKALQGYIKEKNDFFGGKVGNKEKKELYNYITSGDFSEELYSTHANVADAAFLWKYKDKIFKMLTGQGVEKGKASVINKITSPNLGRKSRHVDSTIKSGFDPAEFMK